MNNNIAAEIIAIGTELLLGEITDTNSVFIARALRDVGVNVFYMTTVGDNEDRIAEVIRNAFDRADIVITCGGLGPTVDDVTRQGFAIATDQELEFRQQLYDEIAERFASFRSKMSENNRRQAFIPHNATPITNPVGSAPAFRVPYGDKFGFSLPGVPREMKYLMTHAVIPFLQTQYQLGIIKARILRTAGIGESALDAMIGTELLEQSNPTVGLAAHHGTVDIRITAKAPEESTADEMLAVTASNILDKVSDYVFGEDTVDFEDFFIDFVNTYQETITVTEAGDFVGLIDRIKDHSNGTTILGNTQQFPSLELLTEQYPRRDAPIQEYAEQVVKKICQESNSNYGVVIVSDADVDDNADDKIATVVAIQTPVRVHSRGYGFGAKSNFVKDWVPRWAMAHIWRSLKN